ncbi:hypothetical protein ACIPC1_21130 [Streptomyces sp. NPDC087263]|uniref:hypothetical protein n=1 Tax=Streptomyces sp. NPDC087263 TaxID=3365773 RepID=UPI00381C4842
MLHEPSDGDGGRGLLIVVAPAERWGVVPREDGAYKTVWAEISVLKRLGGVAG